METTKKTRAKRTKRPNSAVIWRGISQLDGITPIVVIVTGMTKVKPSNNEKTGGMVQTYIVVDNTRPIDAINDGSDAAICGDCPHRRQTDGKRSCYVNLATGLLSVGRQLLAARYPEITPESAGEACTGKAVRLGTYGDPAAVPLHVWASLLRWSRTHTGYTHQWRTPAATGLRSLVMASCDSEADRVQAKASGWRTFRVRRVDATGPEPLTPGEIVCPASSEAGKRSTCEKCGLCAGSVKQAKDIAIIDHSSRALAVRKRLNVIQA